MPEDRVVAPRYVERAHRRGFDVEGAEMAPRREANQDILRRLTKMKISMNTTIPFRDQISVNLVRSSFSLFVAGRNAPYNT